MSQLRPPRRLIQIRLYRLVNQNPPTFDSSHFQLTSNRLPTTTAAEPPANSDPPAEPLAEPAAQPEAGNQLISRFWCILLVLSFSYQFYHALRVFLQRLIYLVFLQVLLLPCLAYSTFHVSLGHNFGFSFAFVTVVRTRSSF